MSADKYPSIFSRQMEAIVYISHVVRPVHVRFGRLQLSLPYAVKIFFNIATFAFSNYSLFPL